MSQGIRNVDGSPHIEEQVIDFNQLRNEKMNEKRRKTERIFFKQLLGVYCVTDGGDKMRPIELIDVSEDGCAFQVPFDAAQPWPQDLADLSIRLYFSQDTYLPIRLKIQNSRPSIENGARYVRFGCTVDQTLKSYEAYQNFVRFLKLYAEHAHKDKGEVTLFYL